VSKGTRRPGVIVGASSYSNIRIETAKSLSDARQIDSALACKEAESGSRTSYAVMYSQDRWLHLITDKLSFSVMGNRIRLIVYLFGLSC